MFTADMKKALPEEALAKIGAQIKSWGAVEKIGDPSPRQVGPNTILDFPSTFASHNIIFRFIVNRDGLVAGMFQLPGETTWQRPAYSKPDSFRERDVTVGDGQWKLSGTLTRARARLRSQRPGRNRRWNQSVQGSGRRSGVPRRGGSAV
jgi:hypothetical protein